MFVLLVPFFFFFFFTPPFAPQIQPRYDRRGGVEEGCLGTGSGVGGARGQPKELSAAWMRGTTQQRDKEGNMLLITFLILIRAAESS